MVTEPPSSAPDMSEAEEDHSGRYSDGGNGRRVGRLHRRRGKGATITAAEEMVVTETAKTAAVERSAETEAVEGAAETAALEKAAETAAEEMARTNDGCRDGPKKRRR